MGPATSGSPPPPSGAAQDAGSGNRPARTPPRGRHSPPGPFTAGLRAAGAVDEQGGAVAVAGEMLRHPRIHVAAPVAPRQPDRPPREADHLRIAVQHHQLRPHRGRSAGHVPTGRGRPPQARTPPLPRNHRERRHQLQLLERPRESRVRLPLLHHLPERIDEDRLTPVSGIRPCLPLLAACCGRCALATHMHRPSPPRLVTGSFSTTAPSSRRSNRASAGPSTSFRPLRRRHPAAPDDAGDRPR